MAHLLEQLDDAFDSVTEETCSGLIKKVREVEDKYWSQHHHGIGVGSCASATPSFPVSRRWRTADTPRQRACLQWPLPRPGDITCASPGASRPCACGYRGESEERHRGETDMPIQPQPVHQSDHAGRDDDSRPGASSGEPMGGCDRVEEVSRLRPRCHLSVLRGNTPKYSSSQQALMLCEREVGLKPS